MLSSVEWYILSMKSDNSAIIGDKKMSDELKKGTMKMLIKEVFLQGVGLRGLNFIITGAFKEAGCDKTLIFITKENQKQHEVSMNEKLQADIFRLTEFIKNLLEQYPNPVVIGPYIIKVIKEIGIETGKETEYNCDFKIISIKDYNELVS